MHGQMGSLMVPEEVRNHAILCIPMCDIMGVFPYSEAKNLRDPQGISISNVIVSIADHCHIIFAWGSQRIPLKDHHHSLLCKV